MTRITIFLILTVITLNCNAQIRFSKGYFIDKNDKRTECLIKDIDWRNNPSKFEYRLPQHSEKKTGTLKNIKTFCIYDNSKYVRFRVEIDRSRDETGVLSSTREPIFNREVLFLKVLIEGPISLFSYQDGAFRRYFYKTENAPVKQLIHKKYLNSSGFLKMNNSYKQQLNEKLKTPKLTPNEVKDIRYRKKDLINYFERYYQITGKHHTNYEKKKTTKKNINLCLRPGVNAPSLSIRHYRSSHRRIKFNRNINYRLGLELEYIFPFNQNKWSAIIEPTFQSYKEKTLSTDPQTLNPNMNVTVDYKSIEIPVGIRHYLYISEKSRIFLNAAYAADFAFDSKIDFIENQQPDMEISSVGWFVWGVGCSYKNKYHIEIRHVLGRELLNGYNTYSSNYNSFSIILGYNLFHN